MILCRDHNEAVHALQTQNPQRVFTQHVTQNTSVAFLFPGMGAEYLGMANTLYQQEPLFREAVEDCLVHLRPLGINLTDLISSHNPSDGLQGIPYRHAPVALFVVGYALAKFWQRCGVEPAAMLGYSGGEYTAACLNYVCSLEAMLTIMVISGQTMETLSEGALLAVAAPEQQVKEQLNGDSLSIAAINGPLQCVVAGTVEAIEALSTRLQQANIPCHRVPGQRAFHSSLAEPLAARLHSAFQNVSLHAPQTAWLSGVTGQWITPQEATDPRYYAEKITLKPVRFADSVTPLLSEPDLLLLEVGPGQVLTPLVLQHPKWSREQRVIASQLDPRYGQSEHAALLTALAKLWLSGVDIDWQGFFALESRRRLPLPTYPFQTQRHWIDPKPLTPTSVTQQQTKKKTNISDWFYVPTWQRIALSPAPLPPADNERWLIIGKANVAISLYKQLKSRGCAVIWGQFGTEFSKMSAECYQIGLDDPQSYFKLCQNMAEQGFIPTHIVHTGLVNSPKGAGLAYGFYSVLYLMQALTQQWIGEAARLHVLSNTMQSVLGTESLVIEKSAVLGLLKVIPQEFSHLICSSLDLDGEGADVDCIAQILDECRSSHSRRTVALRAGHRWEQHVTAVSLPVAQNSEGLKQDGVYLITGGLGRIGLLLAEFLAERVHAKCVLLSRRTLPDSSQWTDYLSKNKPDDPNYQVITRLQNIRSLGGDYELMTGDVADTQALQQAISQAKQRFKRLDGVFHAAGLVGDESIRLIAQTDRDYCEKHFQGKLYGILALSQVLRDEPIDFVMLFSSLSSILGGLGFGAYAAGNCVLDAVAQQCDTKNHWLSVNWDGWAFETQEHDSGKVGASLEALAMQCHEGLKALQTALLYKNHRQLIVSTGDLNSRISQWVETDTSDAGAISFDTTAKNNRPHLMTDYHAPRDDIEANMARLWQGLLGIDPIGIYDNFFELGGNSLLMTQLITHIRKSFHIELSLTDLFNAPFVADMAEQIKTLRGEKPDRSLDNNDWEEGEL
ncbi:SDR family oxidoreductase [Thioflexithrix psekupsensis]|uniref:Carrier domain-containing protein n=1 Tax=Thioflexithrix psekupsensis TaxID=1570016 RepID=A0A251XC74_9GAMM|nr:SDR family oxidoreductase [Thioflexithrix psekupsensis]OUD15690.1 hypothetical protein TPSD3_04020 [Thioflexithrix psekupsensis]